MPARAVPARVTSTAAPPVQACGRLRAAVASGQACGLQAEGGCRSWRRVAAPPAACSQGVHPTRGDALFLPAPGQTAAAPVAPAPVAPATVALTLMPAAMARPVLLLGAVLARP